MLKPRLFVWLQDFILTRSQGRSWTWLDRSWVRKRSWHTPVCLKYLNLPLLHSIAFALHNLVRTCWRGFSAVFPIRKKNLKFNNPSKKGKLWFWEKAISPTDLSFIILASFPFVHSDFVPNILFAHVSHYLNAIDKCQLLLLWDYLYALCLHIYIYIYKEYWIYT